MYAETPVPQGPSGLDILLQVAPFFVVAIVVVIVLAFFLARVGGPLAEASVTGGAAASRPSQRVAVPALVAIGASILGFVVGRQVAHDFSAGGFFGFSAILLIFLLGVAVVGLALTGLIAAAFRHGFSSAIGRVIASAGLLAVGAVVGDVTAVATGGAYPAPVFLTADADVQVRLDRASVPFVAGNGDQAECRSVQDGRDVQEVTALALGEFGAGTLQATISIGPRDPEDTSMVMAIDQGDVTQGTPQPTWQMGPIKTTQFRDAGTFGTLTFELARDLEAEAMSGTPASLDWPGTLSGVMSWSCAPW
jgi:hypothetical protein